MLEKLLGKSKKFDDIGPPRKLLFRYRFRSNRDFQSRMFFSSDTNLRSTVQGLLNSVTSSEARRVRYQVTYPSGQVVLNVSKIMEFVEAHTILGSGSVVQMDVVVWDGPPIEKSKPKRREGASGSEGEGGMRCVVQ